MPPSANIKDLLNHDQLMHAKSANYCEICFEPIKARQDLYEHYKMCHLADSGNTENVSINNHNENILETSCSSENSERVILNELEVLLLNNNSMCPSTDKTSDPDVLNLDGITLDPPANQINIHQDEPRMR